MQATLDRPAWRWQLKTRTPGQLARPAQLVQQVDLYFLDLQQAFPLVVQQVVELLVQVTDLQLGLQVDLVVVLGARAVGLPCGSRADLVEALFSSGFTTRTTATETSGRGVGLSALVEEARLRGGIVEVESTFGRGTRFVVRVPAVECRSTTRDEVTSVANLRAGNLKSSRG